MPTASARGASLTDCQYVAIAGISVQAQAPLTMARRIVELDRACERNPLL